ncbi:MAG: ferritin-like domain-containing protein [Chloroflexota bacterium]|nr:ferritin-like domain-containing protein [Chloroflexota bacterium]
MGIQNDVGESGIALPKGAIALGGAAMLSAVALAASKGGGLAFAQDAPFKNDLDVLNYALTLEFFEATLYKTLLGTGKLQGRDLQYVTLFGQHEQAHVDAVQATIQKLGGTPVTKGNYNFGAAGPLDTREQVLGVLATVEQVGVSAYLGAAGYIQNKDILAAAASIMQVEGRHTALIRFLLGQPPVPDAFVSPLTPAEVLTKVTPFFNK